MLYWHLLEDVFDYFYMNGKILGGIVVALVVIGGGWYLISNQANTAAPQQMTSNTPSNTTPTGTTSPTTGTSVKPTITYTNNGFSPSTLTVALGTTVTFVNQSSNPMWVASNPHPTHQGYDGTTKNTHCASGYTGPAPFDECTTVDSGGTYTFTFTKTGSWGYHNHALESDGGTVVVTGSTGASANVNVTM
jgi:plastocyanin